MVARAGSTVTLGCDISGQPSPDRVRWRLNGRGTVRENWIEQEGGRRLHISDASPSDAGEYVCAVTDDAVGSIDSRKIELKVHCKANDIYLRARHSKTTSHTYVY